MMDDDELEAVRQEHEDFLTEVEIELCQAILQGDINFLQVRLMLDTYNPETKDYDDPESLAIK